MTNEAFLSSIAELLMTHGPELVKEAVDIVHSKDPDPVGQFELRRAAYYEGLQIRLDERFKG